ncbi:Lrp/AsnC family transcriptional regulator [Oculatella sp. LEGE 06141]|uniref:Lrp/AsnC family transcriptional regulator n=1 Tax=Oculatella sp. LEGE 06141 TaxID=1828648 RepID=UPI001880EF89|nr:Lrp/AsnC family transcriptional regulator [Oculatella sp. LEGE 06141]MBE9180654.1 Lrp/AsnC family transcriptional regulator [Oculatella sp. LEGE 06141]
MALESQVEVDGISWQILQALQEDARLSYSELGRRVGLSSPAVVERVRRMEEAGIIVGYRAEVNLEKLGLPIMAFMRVASPPGQCASISTSFLKFPEVLECHRVTGSDDYIVKVAVSSVGHLELLIDQFDHSQVTTLIVLSSPITRRTITPAATQVGKAELR